MPLELAPVDGKHELSTGSVSRVSLLAWLTAMGNIFHAPGYVPFLSALAVALVVAGALAVYWRGRTVRLRRNSEVFWISSLHFFSKELSECNNPQQMVDQSLRGALEMLDAQDGCLMLHEVGDEGNVHSAIRGISPQAGERLDQDPLRSFVLSSAERWGVLMAFPDLRRSEVVAAWQRDPGFHEFRDILRSEGLRTLIVVGLQVRDKSYGALILGFRRVRTLGPQELRVAMAIGNQVSVAIENWSLNRAAERREDELRILHRIGEALRSTFDMNAQIEIFRRELKGLLGGTNFGLDLQDSTEGALEVVVPFEGAGPQGTVAGGPASSLAQFVQRTRQPLLVASNTYSSLARQQGAYCCPAIRICIEGVDGIVLGGDKQHIVHLAVAHRQSGHIKRLRVDSAIHGKRKQLAEGIHIHIGRGQRSLLGILTGVGVVITPGENRDRRLSLQWRRRPAYGRSNKTERNHARERAQSVENTRMCCRNLGAGNFRHANTFAKEICYKLIRLLSLLDR